MLAQCSGRIEYVGCIHVVSTYGALTQVWCVVTTVQGHKRLVLTGVVSLFNELDRTATEGDSPSDGCEGDLGMWREGRERGEGGGEKGKEGVGLGCTVGSVEKRG